MMEMDAVNIAGGAVIGGIVALGGRIIFDWLKNQRVVKGSGVVMETAMPYKSTPPVDDPNDHFDQDKCDVKHKEINDWKSGIEVCLVQHKGMIQTHEKRLDKGSKDFEEVKKDISGLNTSYAVLASKIK